MIEENHICWPIKAQAFLDSFYSASSAINPEQKKKSLLNGFQLNNSSLKDHELRYVEFVVLTKRNLL